MSDDSQPNYRWPWVVLVLFILGAFLAVVWMLAEVKRLQRIHRDPMSPPAQAATNGAAR
jgi:hypothetical protein